MSNYNDYTQKAAASAPYTPVNSPRSTESMTSCDDKISSNVKNIFQDLKESTSNKDLKSSTTRLITNAGILAEFAFNKIKKQASCSDLNADSGSPHSVDSNNSDGDFDPLNLSDKSEDSLLKESQTKLEEELYNLAQRIELKRDVYKVSEKIETEVQTMAAPEIRAPLLKDLHNKHQGLLIKKS